MGGCYRVEATDHDDGAGELTIDHTTGENMTTAKIDRPRRAYRSPIRFGIAAGVLVAVLVVAGCGDDDSGDGAAFTEDDALEIVETYYTAAEAGDADAITALFVDPIGDAFDENLRFQMWHAGQEAVRVDRVCTAIGAESVSVVVTCEFGDHQYLERVVGAPATQKRETFTVSDGGIEEFDETWLNDGYDGGHAFDPWMLANHPEDAAAAGCCSGDTVEEARSNGELRRQYAEEWAAYLTESGCTYTDVGC